MYSPLKNQKTGLTLALHINYVSEIICKIKSEIFQNICRDPGSNRGPLDLQSNALPTELSRQVI